MRQRGATRDSIWRTLVILSRKCAPLHARERHIRVTVIVRVTYVVKRLNIWDIETIFAMLPNPKVDRWIPFASCPENESRRNGVLARSTELFLELRVTIRTRQVSLVRIY